MTYATYENHPQGRMVNERVIRTVPQAHRKSVSAADLLGAVALGATSLVNGGSLTLSATYNNKVVGGNGLGRTTPTAGTAQTLAATGTIQTLRIPITQLSGAEYYDIYVSTDADPKWVGRITETQRAAGVVITAVGTTTSGGVAGSVDVQVPGTGLAAGASATVNTAFKVPAVTVDAQQYTYIDFDLELAQTGDVAVPSLKVRPVVKNAADEGYYALAETTLTFGPLRQRLRVDVRGAAAVALLVTEITGGVLNVHYSHS